MSSAPTRLADPMEGYREALAKAARIERSGKVFSTVLARRV
jgi:hypothetical protein